MKVTINGEASEVPDGLTVRGLIERLGLTTGPVAVERNREVVPRAEHASTRIEEGDSLELVHFVGGGLRGLDVVRWRPSGELLSIETHAPARLWSPREHREPQL